MSAFLSTASSTLTWAFAAALLVLTMAAMGTAGWTAIRACGAALPASIQLIVGIGLLELIAVSWAFSHAQRPLREAFIWLIGGCVVAIGLAQLIARKRAGQAVTELASHIRQQLPLAAAFVFYAIFVAWVMTSRLTAGDLAVVTLGNNDIFNYTRLADFLLDARAGTGNIAGVDLRSMAHGDVFGAFALIAWTSYLFNDFSVNVSIAPITAACALIATAIAAICRSTLRLPPSLCFALGLLPLTTALFWQVALQYFFSQLLGSAVVMMAVGCFLSLAAGKQFSMQSAVIGCAAFSTCLFFVYWVLFMPNMALVVAVLGWIALATSIRRPLATFLPRDVAAAILMALAAAGASVLAMALIASDRVMHTYEIFRNAEVSTAGSPFGFISPASMFGIPLAWRAAIDWRGLTELVILIAAFALAAVLIVRRSDDLRRKLLELTPLGLSGLLLALYVAMWLRYGHSYVQWKFAASYPLMFAFGLAASLSASIIRWPRFESLQIGRVIATIVFGLAIWGTMAAVIRTNRHVQHHPRAIQSVAAIDAMPEIKEVFVDLPGFGLRLLAANFIREKTLHFTGPTYYGLGVPAPAVSSNATPILRHAKTPPAHGVLKDLGGGFYLAGAQRP